MKKEEVKIAVGYVRVSTEEQVQGTSLGSQAKAIKEYAKKTLGITMLDENIFSEEGVSAKLIDRPELAKLLDFCARNKGTVTHCIVWKVDRLARKAEYHHLIKAQLAKFGVKLVSVTEPISDDPTGNLMDGILASFAQFDNEIRLLRTTGGMKARTEQGGWPHDAPIGYVKWRTPTGITSVKPNLADEMANKVTSFLNEFSTGSYTVEQARDLAYTMGVRDKNGKMLRWQTTKNMLQNVLYTGYVKSKYTNGEKIRGVHDALISEGVYIKNQNIMHGNTKTLSKQAKEDWPLRGGFLQHTCGRSMTGGTTKKIASGTRYACSHCRARTLGRAVSTQKTIVHAQFIELLETVAPTENVQKLFKEIVLRVWNDEFKEALSVSGRIETEFAALKNKKSRILDLYIENKLTEQEKTDRLLQLDTDAGMLELQRIDMDSYVNEKEQIIDSALLFMSEPASYWNLASLPLKKRMQDLLFPEGLVYDCEEGFRTPVLSNTHLLIKEIALSGDENPTLVAPTRIELVTSGL